MFPSVISFVNMSGNPVEDKKSNDQSDSPEILKSDAQIPGKTDNIVLARHVFPSQLPVIPVTGHPFFPKMTIPMAFSDEGAKRLLIETAKSETKFVGIFLRRDPVAGNDNSPVRGRDLYKIGVIAEILQVAQLAPGEPVHVMLAALERCRLTEIVQDEPYIRARIEYVIETEMTSNEELKAYSVSLIQSIKELVQLNPLHKDELSLFMSRSSLTDPGRLADFAAAMTTASGSELQDVLETSSIRLRLKKVLVLLKKEVDISRIQVRISKQIEDKLSKQQRDFFLREQLKAIKKELGIEKEGKESEIERFEERLKNLKPPQEALDRIREELDKLRLIEPASPEFTVSRTYLDWLTILPWGVFTKDSYDLKRAGRVLNKDHYGLEDVKERILEFLAVGIRKGNISGTILCFVGPPGVGKTSLGHSIANSLNRNFYRFSVGGIQDEAEIKGHRRTYIGALPGKFIQAIKVCKSSNPVIMLDEIDKIGSSYRGDPASALLEVLDPEQNRDFLDHYLDVRFDLSNVFFICTANLLDTIPRPLLDRMEIIKLPGYIMQEKVQIARRHLVPKQLEHHGFKPGDVSITDRAIKEIIDGYSREPGVRGLENHIKKILRKSVRRLLEHKKGAATIDKAQVATLLGKRIFSDDSLYKKPQPGVVMGLAWTSMGGDTLHVEATSILSDKPGFKQTGQLGNVMVESSEIAYTYIRSLLSNKADTRQFFDKNFVHLHVPAGATPKDGPSAGVTMASALYSLAINRPILPGFAMTGELSLTGLVMPIGGVKEKTIAAKRAKVRHLVFPQGNRKDFSELPAQVRKGLTAHFVSKFSDIAALCFPSHRRRSSRKAKN